MKCPRCGNPDTRVIDSRELDEGSRTRRRRECAECTWRFTTYERFEDAGLIVVKKDGRRENYDRDKLARGIKKALEKRPHSADDVVVLLNGIEQRLHEIGHAEVRSSVIGELVLNTLKALDPVAYIRFASVYVGYADLEAMKREVDALLRPSTIELTEEQRIPEPVG
jgi:transcriptional repressor NrdR